MSKRHERYAGKTHYWAAEFQKVVNIWQLHEISDISNVLNEKNIL